MLLWAAAHKNKLDESQRENSSGAADLELKKEDVNLTISEEWDKELAPQVCRQAASVNSSGFNFSGLLATLASSNPFTQFWIVKQDFAEPFSRVE